MDKFSLLKKLSSWTRLILDLNPRRWTRAMSYFVVPTSDGNVKGKLTKTRSNFPYYAFYKIPFAKPPVGDLR